MVLVNCVMQKWKKKALTQTASFMRENILT